MDKFLSPKLRNVLPLVRIAVEHVTAGVRYTVTDRRDKFVLTVLTPSSPTAGRQHDDATWQHQAIWQRNIATRTDFHRFWWTTLSVSSCFYTYTDFVIIFQLGEGL